MVVYKLIFMVPIAPFGIFGNVFEGAGGMSALACAIGIPAMLFGAGSYAQMSLAFPMAGSMNSLVPDVPVWLSLIALVVLSTVVKFFGIMTTARINRVMLLADLVILAIFLVVGGRGAGAGQGHRGGFTPIYSDAGPSDGRWWPGCWFPGRPS